MLIRPEGQTFTYVLTNNHVISHTAPDQITIIKAGDFAKSAAKQRAQQ